MKKILSLVICGVLLFGVIGCGKDNNSNTLTCTGEYFLSYGFYMSMDYEGNIDGYAFEDKANMTGLGDVKYIFNFSENKVVSIKAQETISKELSQQDGAEEELEEMGDKVYKDNNGRFVVESTWGSDDRMVIAFNQFTDGKEDLKELLEEKTGLTCK